MDFADLESKGEKVLQEAIALGQAEGLTLDFKADHPRNPLFVAGALTAKGNEVVGKALSAFANSAGGLLIFGVECKTVDGVDLASKLVPLPDLARSLSSLNAQAAQLLMPRVDGLRVLAISSQNPDTGYLAVEVPRSERRPHMSMADRQYYKRSGASSFRMEHYDIEDAFRRQMSPILALRAVVKVGEIDLVQGGSLPMRVELLVENSGNSTAKSVSVRFSRWRRLQPSFGSRYIRPLVSEHQIDGDSVLVAEPGFSVNPGEAKRLDQINFALSYRNGQYLIGGKPMEDGVLGADYSISAEDCWPQRGSFSLDPSEIGPFTYHFKGP